MPQVIDNPTSEPTTLRPQPTATPSLSKTPELVWVDGVEPTSELENHPLVRAAREASFALDLAWNTGDYSSDLLVTRATEDLIMVEARMYSYQGNDPRVYVYAEPWAPVEILRYDDTGGAILACFLASSGGTKTTTSSGGVYDRSRTVLKEISMIVENGELKFGQHTWPMPRAEECDGSTVPVGFFDPAPELPPTPVTKPVKPPPFDDWKKFE